MVQLQIENYSKWTFQWLMPIVWIQRLMWLIAPLISHAKNSGPIRYLISDLPHLIKTAPDCLANSGCGWCTRYNLSKGMYLIWNYIADMFYDNNRCSGFHILPKLSNGHIRLTPDSVTNVKLAFQELSSLVSKALLQHCPPEATASSQFSSLFDSFLISLNSQWQVSDFLVFSLSLW